MAEAETIAASGISILYVDVLRAGCGEASERRAGRSDRSRTIISQKIR